MTTKTAIAKINKVRRNKVIRNNLTQINKTLKKKIRKIQKQSQNQIKSKIFE